MASITPGQYYLLSVPHLGLGEWHPFSSAVAAVWEWEEEELAFVVKDCGGWGCWFLLLGLRVFVCVCMLFTYVHVVFVT